MKGISFEIRVFFPKGRIDFLRYWFDLSDVLMSDDLGEIEILKLKVRERIKTIIKLRLERWKGYKVSIKKTLPFLLMPSYTTHFTFSLMQTSNLIWKIAGLSKYTGRVWCLSDQNGCFTLPAGATRGRGLRMS